MWGGYFGSENPACGGVHENGSGNAYYCRPDDYLAWDWNLLVSQFSDEAIGDSFVYFVIAHEWGTLSRRVSIRVSCQQAANSKRIVSPLQP